MHYGVSIVSGLSVLVPGPAPDVPPQGPPLSFPDPSQPSPPPGPPLPVAGRLYSPPPSVPTPFTPVLDSDVRNDACLELLRHCLQVLAVSQKEVMMVVCELDFRKYLDGETDPIHRAQCALFPRPADLRAEGKDKGDFDILILHRTHGLVIMEAKSVGAKHNIDLTDEVVVRKVRQAVGQLEKAEDVLRHLVKDLKPTPKRVIKRLMMPYLTSRQLSQALTTAPGVAKVSACGGVLVLPCVW